ncbi:hypothetical protein BAE44_0024267 [Dichanthelium oligosanthes]|uniref:LRR receptor-like serine/threonine-protein kinase n=1 Tax=Dichanthelium oligosanthes TaxID=888268 RepID=A0A1E5UPE0_9POAL|nr:hypothetical protein BAE44_0024267 [Dichanthelium oligosanthes]
MSLEALDLSWNDLSGPIPTSITNLTNLSLLDLSYNYLSERIPTGNQLESFSQDSYIGNANLCGPPLDRKCSHHNSKHQHQHQIESGKHQIESGTYLCAVLGFAFGVSIVSAILLFSATARKAYFQFTDSKLEEFRTAVEIKVNWVKGRRGQSMETRRVCSQNSITCYELEFGSPAPGQ